MAAMQQGSMYTTLHDKLREVQQIKNEGFVIGTREIIDYLRDAERLDERLETASAKINAKLGDGYKATPERIYAVAKVASAVTGHLPAYEEMLNVDSEAPIEERVLRHIFGKDEVVNYVEDSFLPFTTLEQDVRDRDVDGTLYEKWSAIFRSANSIGVQTNNGFFEFLRSSYFPKQLKDMPEGFIDALGKLEPFDFSENYREARNAALRHYHLSRISTDKLIARLMNDRVEHREEYVRPILEREVETTLRIDSGLQNYSQIDLSQASEKVYAKLLEIQDDRVSSARDRIAFAPKEIKKNFEDTLKVKLFMRELLGREKSYVIKLIKMKKVEAAWK
jgi:hypothetical protein